MGCLLAEFKLTAMLYGGRREGTTVFWVAPLCTPPLLLSLSFLHLSLSLSLSHRRNLERFFGSSCVVRWSAHTCISEDFTGKYASPDENIIFFLEEENKQNHTKTHTRSRSAITVHKVLCLTWTGIYTSNTAVNTVRRLQ